MQETAGHIYLRLYGAYGVSAMAWCGGVKPLLFEIMMSAPKIFIKHTELALNRASGSEEGAPTESLQKTEGVLMQVKIM
jgi:hypothetical protein